MPIPGTKPRRWCLKIVILSFVPFFVTVSISGKSKSYFSKSEQQEIRELLENKIVTAKGTMPATTTGVWVWWDKKKQEWHIPSERLEIERYGAGVYLGDKKAITRITFLPKGLELWLNDGGVISGSDKLSHGLSTFGGGLNEAVQKAEIDRKRGMANGSRIHILLGDFPITPADSKLAILKQQLGRFIEFPVAAEPEKK